MIEREDGFDLAVWHVDNADVVSVGGVLDLFTAPRLRDFLSDDGLWRGPHLILDLSALSSFDSMGIGTIAEGRRLWAARGNRTVIVARPGTAVHKILHILALDQVMQIAPTVEDAIGSLGPDLREPRGCPAGTRSASRSGAELDRSRR